MTYVSLARASIDAARSVVARPLGPGWFESSWDLHCGLEVREEGRVDAALSAWTCAFAVAPAAQTRLALVASPSAMTAIA